MASEIIKKTHFNRAIELNLTIGSYVLRHVLDMCLKNQGDSLREFLSTDSVVKALRGMNLYMEQIKILKREDVRVEDMDVTLLTKILLKFMKGKLIPDTIKHIKDLRKLRNVLAHVVKAELEDDSNFKEASAHILGLAKSVNISTFELHKTINELKQRELVNWCTNVEKILINNEMHVMKLTPASGEESVVPDKTLMIKIGLNKWAHQLARGLNVSLFLRNLKKQNVISAMEMKQVEEGYSYKEKMELLVLHITHQSKDYIYKFVNCLESMDPFLAAVVVNSDEDLREIGKKIKANERITIVQSLKELFKEHEESSIDTGKVHIIVEEKIGMKVEFSVVKNYVLEVFQNVSHNDNNCFIGLEWNEKVEAVIANEPKESCHERDGTHILEMKCEDFAAYLGNEMYEVRECLLEAFVNAIREESILPKMFASMTKPEMNDVFTPYLEAVNIIYGYGVRSKLDKIQRKLKTVHIDCDVDDFETLRDFDKSVGSTKYRRLKVRTRAGSLLVPKDEFHFPCDLRAFNAYTMSSEIVRFLCACINGRKNGTIHFGIRPMDANTGQVIGIREEPVRANINAEIKQAIEVCFKPNSIVAYSCIRPVQIIPVVDGGVVYEVDVVPSSFRLPRRFLTIDFPPKGYQKEECFVCEYSTECGILPIVSKNIGPTEEIYQAVFTDRAQLENECNSIDKPLLQRKLVKALTGGRTQYLSDEYVSIVVTGKISGSEKEADIRRHLDIQRLCQSSKLILDFDDTSTLRKSVEENSVIFTVKTPEDITNSKSSFLSDLPIWLHCNGYNTQRQGTVMSMEDWLKYRLDNVKKILDWMGEDIPKDRARIIFLMYQNGGLERDPLDEIARLAFVSLFRQQCVFISDSDKTILKLKDELTSTKAERNVNTFFHTSLNWSECSAILQNICRCNPNTVCKLPHCDGYFVEMTKAEKAYLKFTDIDIVSGEECIDEETKMTNEMKKNNKNDARDRFYKGYPVSWWNFYYKTHVGNRDHFEFHKKELKEKLSANTTDALIAVYEIEHHPGAGGSTLGRNLLWHFSQFRNTPQKKYRCCIIENAVVTEETGRQIQRFRDFKEGDCPKPVLILADNLSEDNRILLKRNLHEKAYKNGNPGHLFALIIVINRMPICHEESVGRVLRHVLSESERDWFESKFRELETDNIDVKTLVAFNCLRKSFNFHYMSKLVRDIMSGVSDIEKNILKCLALICTFESDRPVPTVIFDSMVEEKFETSNAKFPPWGIIRTKHEISQLKRSNYGLWTNRMSTAMQLLIKETEDPEYFKNGIQILCQPVARHILVHLKDHGGGTLVEIVDYLLDVTELKVNEGSSLSRNFVRTVGSLFKTRQLIDTDKGDFKEKFADLVLELEQIDRAEIEQGNVVKCMNRCFKITEDPMVGQQLARYHIHVSDFESAEQTVRQSLELSESWQKPYILDTYGQIYKSKADTLLERKRTRYEKKISDEQAAEFIRLTFQAIEKFSEGQYTAVEFQKHINFCFHTEVRVAMHLLEMFDQFACFQKDAFKQLLNDNSFDVDGSCFSNLMKICPEVEYIRYGNEKQQHVESSLRMIEERNYQVKMEFYTIYSENEKLLLKMRERFERFYGRNNSGYKYKYGIGLKALMRAKSKDPEILEARVKEARSNLETCGEGQVDERDLLVYLGEKIVCLSDQANNTEYDTCEAKEYQRLLSYSARLVSIITKYPGTKRKYLESYLYFALLHWPLKSRTDLNLDALAKPSAYKEVLCQWEEAYKSNFHIKTPEQNRTNKPKNYFALGKGTPGNEIVDLEAIWKEWRSRKKTEGRTRQPVFKDDVWGENFVEERLERLEGVVNGNGSTVTHEAEYQLGTHVFEINTYYQCHQHSNREVTFILGFTWKGLTALDVKERGVKIPKSDDSDESKCLQHENEHNFKASEEGIFHADESSKKNVRGRTSKVMAGVDVKKEKVSQPKQQNLKKKKPNRNKENLRVKMPESNDSDKLKCVKHENEHNVKATEEVIVHTDDNSGKSVRGGTSKGTANVDVRTANSNRMEHDTVITEEKHCNNAGSASGEENISFQVSQKTDYTAPRKTKPNKKKTVFQPKPQKHKKKKQQRNDEHLTVSPSSRTVSGAVRNVISDLPQVQANAESPAPPEQSHVHEDESEVSDLAFHTSQMASFQTINQGSSKNMSILK